jgi:hypothetical protein
MMELSIHLYIICTYQDKDPKNRIGQVNYLSVHFLRVVQCSELFKDKSNREERDTKIMGVPKFYRWISERFPQINQLLTGATILPEFDNFYLDMNGIIHGI